MYFCSLTRLEYVVSSLTAGSGFFGKISIMLFFNSTIDVILLGIVVDRKIRYI